MKLGKRVFGLVSLLSVLGCLTIFAQEEISTLPSEQTHQQLEQMYTMDNQASSPSLRSGPPGGGGPPIGGTPIGEIPIIALAITSIGYAVLKKKN